MPSIFAVSLCSSFSMFPSVFAFLFALRWHFPCSYHVFFILLLLFTTYCFLSCTVYFYICYDHVALYSGAKSFYYYGLLGLHAGEIYSMYSELDQPWLFALSNHLSPDSRSVYSCRFLLWSLELYIAFGFVTWLARRYFFLVFSNLHPVRCSICNYVTSSHVSLYFSLSLYGCFQVDRIRVYCLGRLRFAFSSFKSFYPVLLLLPIHIFVICSSSFRKGEENVMILEPFPFDFYNAIYIIQYLTYSGLLFVLFSVMKVPSRSFPGLWCSLLDTLIANLRHQI